MTHNELLERLVTLETELHRLETRRDTKRLEQLLHPDFVEFGRSGRRYSRAEVVKEFVAQDATLEAVRSDNFVLAEIAPDVALLTYSSAHELPSGECHRHTLRSSLWLKTEAGWQMRFHQGTPAESPMPVT